MRCIAPIKAGFNSAGDIVYSSRKASLELEAFEFECRKCLPCRLNIAREKAIRAVHEAQCHENNLFLTLTYDEEHLRSPKLIYEDWQLFIKRLRERITRDITSKEAKDALYIPYMVTGEYGDKRKRPHWHAILFNYNPHDKSYKYTTETGHRVWESEFLTKLWGKGIVEYGDVTMDSAGYVARYAAKKLVHGKDQDHDYHPVHRTSCRRAIGRSWIEKNWRHTFENGYVYLPNGEKTKIPRYYLDWAKKHMFDVYKHYVNNAQMHNKVKAMINKKKEENERWIEVTQRRQGKKAPITKTKMEMINLNQKFKRLQEELKL